MHALGKATITSWAVLTLGSLLFPGIAHAQLFGGGGFGGGMFGGGGGGGMGMGMGTGMGRMGGMGGGYSGSGGLLGSGMTAGNSWEFGGGRQGRGGLFNNNSNQNGPAYPGYNTYPGQGYYNNYNTGQMNPGYYTSNYNAGRTTPAIPATSNPGQPYLATDGKWYYPDGRPYTPPTARPTRATTTAATAPTPAPATPAVNVIPDLDGSGSLANNVVRTRVPAASSSVHDELAQLLGRSLEEGIERLESSLGEVLFGEADAVSFLAIYKRTFTEDSPQYRLARKNIKYLDAGELRQGLIDDAITDAGAMVYPAKLEVSAALDTFKRTVLAAQSAAEVERATKGLLKTYEGVIRQPEFVGLNVPPPNAIREALTGLRQLVEVRQRQAEGKAPAPEGLVTMDRRFRLVRYPGLPLGTVQALDPQVCLWGTGAGRIEIQDAELIDLGVPLLNPGAAPLGDSPKPAPYSGVLVQNPRANRVTVHYVIDDVSYELKSGESRTHKITTKSKIKYHRGGTQGDVAYQLSSGTYRFAIQSRAWQVNKISFAVTIDNAANGCDFHCEIDGQPRTIAAHKMLQVTSAYPIAIRFDQGSGQSTASKILGDTRQVTVGVAPGSMALDLFPGTSQQLAVRPVSPEPIAAQANPATATTPKLGRQPVLPTAEDLQ